MLSASAGRGKVVQPEVVRPKAGGTVNGPLCNLFALEQGLDPIGYAGTLDAFLAMEVPLPWPRDVFENHRKLPGGAREAIAWFTRETPYRLRTLAVAPDRHYSSPGKRRVLWFSRPSGPLTEYLRHEYQVPEELLGSLVSALVRGEDTGPFEQYREQTGMRDILVCTHGAQDAACGRFGIPLYEFLRRAATEQDDARVWRVTHLGGHVFAPTLLDLPSGRSWAYLNDESALEMLEQRGNAEALRDNYRGWAALESPFLQAFERELLVREGWQWLGVPKTAEVLRQDDSPDPQWAEVALDAWCGDVPKRHLARVEISHSLPIRPRSDQPDVKPYSQYRVELLEGKEAPPQAALGPG